MNLANRAEVELVLLCSLRFFHEELYELLKRNNRELQYNVFRKDILLKFYQFVSSKVKEMNMSSGTNRDISGSSALKPVINNVATKIAICISTTKLNNL